MNKENQALRDELALKHISFQVLADEIGIHKNTLYLKLKKRLSPEMTARINLAIQKILDRREAG